MSEVPDGWSSLRLSDVAPIDTQQVLPAEQPDANFNYIALENIESGSGKLIGVHPVLGQTIKSNKFGFTTDHVLFGKLRPYLNKVVVPDRPGICSTDILPLRPRVDLITREFLSLALRNPEFVEFSRTRMEGTKMPRLRTLDLEAYEIPVPPLAEQGRIVARIEALTRRLEEARQARQAAVAEAVTAFRAVADRAFRDATSNPWVAIGCQAKVQGGYAFKSSWFVQRGIRLLRNQNVYHGELDWSDTVRLPEERRREFNQFELAEGDVVISMDRPLISSGLKAAQVGAEDLPCLLLQRVGRFVCRPGLEPAYLFHFLNTEHFMPHISGDGRSSAVPHISAKQIEAIAMPLPDLAEQRRIVARLDALRAKVDELQRLQREVEAELAAFTPALLAKAFRGEL